MDAPYGVKMPLKFIVHLDPEEMLLLLFRAHHSSWRAFLAWLREHAPHRLDEVRPIIQRLQAIERRHRIRLEPPPNNKPSNSP